MSQKKDPIPLLIDRNPLLLTPEDEVIIKKIHEIVSQKRNSFFFILKQPENKTLLDWLNFKTPKLNEGDFEYSIGTKCFWVFNGLLDFPKCQNPSCSNIIGYHRDCGIGGYLAHCSNRCKTLDPAVQAKIVATVQSEHGLSCKWTSSSNEAKSACKHTCQEKYKVDNIFQSGECKAKIKETVAKNHDGNPNYRNSERRLATCAELYGQGSNGKAISEALLSRTPEEIDLHVKHIEEAKLQRYGDPHYNNREKAAQTCLDDYGVSCIFLSPEIQAKIKATLLSATGYDHNWKDPECRKRMQEKSLSASGYEYPSLRPEVIQQSKDTKTERYGAPFSPSHHYSYDGKSFDSSYELAFYIWMQDNDIEFEYPCKTTFTYIDSYGTQHTYCPDFKVGNQIIEVKGEHFIGEDGTLVMPYHGKTQEDTEHLKATAKAKFQCMQDNSVVMFIRNDLELQLRYCYEKFGNDKKWYLQFKVRQK